MFLLGRLNPCPEVEASEGWCGVHLGRDLLLYPTDGYRPYRKQDQQYVSPVLRTHHMPTVGPTVREVCNISQ